MVHQVRPAIILHLVLLLLLGVEVDLLVQDLLVLLVLLEVLVVVHHQQTVHRPNLVEVELRDKDTKVEINQLMVGEEPAVEERLQRVPILPA
jgi:hypothetical protein